MVKILFRGGDPLGKYIDISGIVYRVIGVFEDEGSEREQRKIYIPISTAQMAYGGTDQIHRLLFTIGGATFEESERITEETRRLFASRHGP